LADGHGADLGGPNGRTRRLYRLHAALRDLTQALDEDRAFQEETLNVARSLGNAVKLARKGKPQDPAAGLVEPNPK
jgi:hypothetical protein